MSDHITPERIRQFEAEVRAAFPRLLIHYTESHADGFLRCSLGVNGGGDISPTIWVDVSKQIDGTYMVDRCKGSTVVEARDKAVNMYRARRDRVARIISAIKPTSKRKVTP